MAKTQQDYRYHCLALVEGMVTEAYDCVKKRTAVYQNEIKAIIPDGKVALVTVEILTEKELNKIIKKNKW